jgi:hypothetical protein
MALRKAITVALASLALAGAGLTTSASAAPAGDNSQGKVTGSAKACSTVAASSSADSGSVSGVRTALAKDVGPKGDDPECPPAGRGWKYIGEYFWASTCISAGNGGINAGSWKQYQCTCGGAFSDYELWVRK